MTPYTRTAIALHWLIALAIVANLAIGWWMSDAINQAATRDNAVAAFQWHKSIGLTVLLLSLLRLVWRLLNPVPPLPPHMPRWERLAATSTHVAFYLLMIGIPLSGWLYVSTQWRDEAPLTIPTLWFELFEVPHLFALNEASRAMRQSLANITLEAHELLVWAMLLLLLLHVAAALRHHFALKDGLLARMAPHLKTGPATHPQEHVAPRPNRFAACITLGVAFAFVFVATRSTLPDLPNTGAPTIEQALNNLVTTTSTSPTWNTIQPDSQIRFSGAHVGRAFSGKFTQWRAHLQFDPNLNESALIVAVISTGSATDGVPMHDSTLPEREWFDVDSHPYAYFSSTRLEPRAEGEFELSGRLTIKGHTVEINGLMLKSNGSEMRIYGDTYLDRADIDMGMESDPAGDYVSRRIGIHVDITARRLP